MKFIKRISALIPVVLVLLWCVVPFGSMAAGDIENKGDYPETFFDAFPGIDFLQSEVYESSSYVLIYYASDQSGNYPNYRTRSLYIPLNSSLLVDNGSGIYSYSSIPSNSSNSPFYYFYSGQYLAHPSYPIRSDFSLSSTYSTISSFSIDSIAEDVVLNGSIGKDFVADSVSYNVIHFDFVIDGESVGPDEIEVNSFPKLEGDSTLNMYLLDDNGYPIPGKTSDRYLSTQLIDINVKNNSTKPFQFCLYFAEKGGTLELNTQYRQFLGSRFYSNNPLFVYLTEENFYNYDITSHMNRTVNAVSCYHLVQPGQTFTCHVGENQLDLKKGVEYDLVVFGAFIDNHTNAYLENHILDTQFSLFNISGMDPYISLAGSGFDCKEYYRSTFVLDKTSDYKNTQYSNSGDLQIGGLGTSYNNGANQNNDNVFNTIYGQTDQNGNSSYKNSSFSENYGSYHMSYGDGSGLSSISNISLSSSFSSVFGMVTDFFNKLPKGMQDAFTFGFTAVIVIGIIKAVT